MRAVTVFLLLSLSAAAAELRYRPERAPEPGTVFHYAKSNRDGSQAWRLSAFVVSPTRIEVIKWLPKNGTDMVLIHAEMDWQRFMTAHILQWNPTREAMPMRIASRLSRDGKTVDFRLANGGRFVFPVGDVPLHIYGFDFQSLNFAAPHLVEPGKAFSLDLLDPNRPGKDAPFFVARARFEPAGREEIDGVDCFRYRTAGPFFGDAKGFVWLNAANGRLERAENDLRTSTDWDKDYLLDLQSVETMDEFAWQKLKDSIVAEMPKE